MNDIMNDIMESAPAAFSYGRWLIGMQVPFLCVTPTMEPSRTGEITSADPEKKMGLYDPVYDPAGPSSSEHSSAYDVVCQ